MEIVLTSVSDAVKTMVRVIHALLLRETKTRYGRTQLGYIWALLEPILIITVLGFVFMYIRMREVPGMPLVQFLITGFIPFMLFRDIVTQSMTAIRRNQLLLNYPQVHVIDFFISRTLLEFSTTLVVLPMLILIVSFTGIEEVSIQDPLRVFAGLCITCIYAFGIGVGLGSLIPLFPSLQFLVSTIYIRPLFFLSGVFFTVEMLPPEAVSYALINPLFQIIEFIRSGYFKSYESNYVDFNYLGVVIILTLIISLMLQKALRRHAFTI